MSWGLRPGGPTAEEPAAVAALTTGVLNAMAGTKPKVVTVPVVAVGSVVAGIVWLAFRATGADPAAGTGGERADTAGDVSAPAEEPALARLSDWSPTSLAFRERLLQLRHSPVDHLGTVED